MIKKLQKTMEEMLVGILMTSIPTGILSTPICPHVCMNLKPVCHAEAVFAA